METHSVDLDAAFLFKGAPNDQCQAPHMGYVLKGKYGMRIADGVQEVFEAGDAFFIGPGHTPIIFAGCEVVYFTRTEEGNRELAVVVPNLMKYMQEQGMEVPARPSHHHSWTRTRHYTGSVRGRGASPIRPDVLGNVQSVSRRRITLPVLGRLRSLRSGVGLPPSD